MSTSYQIVMLFIRVNWPRRVFGVTVEDPGHGGGRPSSFQWSYGMGDPLAPSLVERNSGGGLHPFVTP
jgi:hypothetical protein